MVLDNASERRFHNQSNSKIIDDDGNTNNSTNKKITYFTDVPLGMYIVRGDSVVLLGQVGSEEEEENNNAVSQQHTAMIVSMKRLQLDEFEAMVAANVDDDKAVAEEEVAGEDESKSLEWDFDKDLLA
jgi:small nuclear ribonucleoprotein (snRNP)-like protein